MYTIHYSSCMQYITACVSTSIFFYRYHCLQYEHVLYFSIYIMCFCIYKYQNQHISYTWNERAIARPSIDCSYSRFHNYPLAFPNFHQTCRLRCPLVSTSPSIVVCFVDGMMVTYWWFRCRSYLSSLWRFSLGWTQNGNTVICKRSKLRAHICIS